MPACCGRQPVTTLRTLLVSLVFAVAGGAVLAAATDGFRVFTTEAARRLEVREHPVTLPDVTLQADTGARISLADFRGRWLLVDFVYTRCVTFCSILGGDFAQLQKSLAAPLASGRLHLLSISFDPLHDDPEALVGYKRRSGDDGLGWSAARPTDAPALATITRAFGIRFIPDGLGGFVHNASIAVVDPEGRLIDVYDTGAPAQVAAAMRPRVER